MKKVILTICEDNSPHIGINQLNDIKIELAERTLYVDDELYPDFAFERNFLRFKKDNPCRFKVYRKVDNILFFYANLNASEINLKCKEDYFKHLIEKYLHKLEDNESTNYSMPPLMIVDYYYNANKLSFNQVVEQFKIKYEQHIFESFERFNKTS